ncbi:DUF1631 domain-containing protein [Pelomonas sp. CA6]|uniref:DUF1631 family protein n=1 Tax=Pelomonas sp. CA6 TaxID=2907999 RepID=UPI001F4A67C9|nr:DUF1631 family protein [Pelomonas sp. CA6]MCH7341937.1 DUF1631 domain-containing protein [Pelomonas sp. CA6]
MNRLNPHLEAALQRVRTAVELAAERGAEGLGLAALSAVQPKRRDALLAAQFIFRKHQALFAQQFYQSLLHPAQAPAGTATAAVGGADRWSELSLMDDEQVNALVAADRIGLALGHQSEWELREVEAYVGAMLPQGGDERHPLRPQSIAQALLAGIHAVSDEAEIRQTLTDELTRALAQEMKACYGDIAELFRSRGLRQQELRARTVITESGRRSGHGSEFGHSTQGGALHSRHGDTSPASDFGRLAARAGSAGGSAGGGMVDAQLMSLLRRLAQLPPGGLETLPGPLAAGEPASGGISPSRWQGWQDWGDSGEPPPNLIHLHREELRQAATGSLDHMVIDVVAGLFDQILSDPKLPPQMAQQIARLQLPVLRAALGDRSFFSSRRHPVRRFVNRIASLGSAYDDFADGPGRDFLARVRDLVQEVVSGDFDRMELYEAKLAELEQFSAEQSAQTLREQGDVAAVVERKETDLRLQQRYMQQLQQALAAVEMQEFLRSFLTQVWSQVIMQASRNPRMADQVDRLRALGRELVLSVQPKSGAAQRQAFLASLPALMRTLNEGLDMIRWPEDARKKFFAELLPAHADSLRGQSLTPLEFNLLAKQLEGIFGVSLPTEKDLGPAAAPLPEDTDLGARLSADEARSLGLLDEQALDWNGEVDIDLSADDPAPLQTVDISLDGLPAAEEPPEPASGALLMDHLQLGFAYRMHVDGQWVKVKLAHVSAGRSFFIFSHGHKQQQTMTMTARMLRKLCDGGRLRAFENAYLLERATARTRKQLAALAANSRH